MNELVILKLKQIADLLEILGESVYKIRSYRKAVETLNLVTDDISVLAKEGKLKDLPGIGDAISIKIEVIVKTGDSYYLQKLTQKIPLEVTSLMRVEGIGGKTAGRLYQELGVKSITGLEEAIKTGALLKLSGFTEGKVEKIQRAIKFLKKERRALPKIEKIAYGIRDKLMESNLLTKVELGGSFRRRKSTVRDLDLHAIGKEENFEKAMKFFTEMEEVIEVIVTGKLKTTVKLFNNMNVDLRIMEEISDGAGILYSTGARSHTIKLRTIAERKELLLNEYGLYNKDKSKLLASKTETDVYAGLGMSYIPPELREDRGEIEAAMKNELPELITIDDIKGDLHAHTDFTDGKATTEEMIIGAEKKGWEYVAITDHYGKNKIYNPLDEEKLQKQKKELEKISAAVEINVLHGLEIDITKTGGLEVPNEILKDMDYVIASIHSHFDLPEEEMTQRILKALDNEYVNAIGHPTSRMFSKRADYSLNFSKIAKKCNETNTWLEINAQPDRQDIDDHLVFDLKVKAPIYIGTDAHYVKDYEFMQWGINIARRSWCEKKHIINCLSFKDLQKKLTR
ncbi:MAG: DNA polymerase/3'-5' exonuclease PolX [Candidatus Heimdallarchaeota archaeon]|nr:DNA polymerase/3'-5' exonuclease PolX [Candidatus Heimdallarchaeota archaeon]MBY8995408.1 DNA polymerase/3'-5' exonuclease PolX [Candidatus Heimdallarchaeota archaeon]